MDKREAIKRRWGFLPSHNFDGEFVDARTYLDIGSQSYKAIDLFEGTYIRVVRNGETHTVFVVPAAPLDPKYPDWHRYIYKGQRYKTLSAVATTITGHKLNGAVLFKLKLRQRGSRPTTEELKVRDI